MTRHRSSAEHRPRNSEGLGRVATLSGLESRARNLHFSRPFSIQAPLHPLRSQKAFESRANTREISPYSGFRPSSSFPAPGSRYQRTSAPMPTRHCRPPPPSPSLPLPRPRSSISVFTFEECEPHSLYSSREISASSTEGATSVSGRCRSFRGARGPRPTPSGSRISGRLTSVEDPREVAVGRLVLRNLPLDLVLLPSIWARRGCSKVRQILIT